MLTFVLIILVISHATAFAMRQHLSKKIEKLDTFYKDLYKEFHELNLKFNADSDYRTSTPSANKITRCGEYKSFSTKARKEAGLVTRGEQKKK